MVDIMMFRNWHPLQVFIPFIPLFAMIALSLVPSELRPVIELLFPGWLAAYTPSVLLTGLFIRQNGWMYWALTQSTILNQDMVDFLSLLIALATCVGGYLLVINQVITILTTAQTFIVILSSGNVLGLLMGYLATLDLI